MKDVFDTFCRCILALFIVFGLFALIGAFMTGCAAAPVAKPKAAASVPAPLAAIVVAECGKAVALYVVLDSTHMALFAGSETVLYEAIGASQLPKVSHTDAVPFDTAMTFAQRAPLTSHVVLPCADVTT